MEIALQILLLVVGFVILIKGADWLIDGASSTASHFKVSKMLIGLTIVAFGTGAPEFAVSISSFINGSTDVLLGNVVGSNIINILLLIGVGALIRPIKIKKDTIRKELPMLLLISVVFVALFLDVMLAGAETNLITRTDGLICVLMFAIFLFYIIATARKNRSAKKEVEKPKFKLGWSIVLVLVGLVGVVGGAELVVNSASTLAAMAGISERVIALTIVALGTSLPELITTITAARKGETDLLVGNIIGSNIFNICIVLGLPVVIMGGIAPEEFSILDPIMLILAVVLLYVFATTKRKITRWEGVAMLAVFAAYYGYVIYGALAG